MSDEVVVIKPIRRSVHVSMGKTIKVSSPGPQGLQGEPGDNVGSYTHSQLIPADEWVIPHNLGYKPAGVSVFDSAGTGPFLAVKVVHDNLNQMTISFALPFAGTAEVS